MSRQLANPRFRQWGNTQRNRRDEAGKRMVMAADVSQKSLAIERDNSIGKALHNSRIEHDQVTCSAKLEDICANLFRALDAVESDGPKSPTLRHCSVPQISPVPIEQSLRVGCLEDALD